MVRSGSLLGRRCCYMLWYGGILKEGGQNLIPKCRFPVFRYRYSTDNEPVFLRVSVSHPGTGFSVLFSVRFSIGIHHGFICAEKLTSKTAIERHTYRGGLRQLTCVSSSYRRFESQQTLHLFIVRYTDSHLSGIPFSVRYKPCSVRYTFFCHTAHIRF